MFIAADNQTQDQQQTMMPTKEQQAEQAPQEQPASSKSLMRFMAKKSSSTHRRLSLKQQQQQQRFPSEATSEASDDSSSHSSGDEVECDPLDMGYIRNYPHAHSMRLDERLWQRFVRNTKKRLNKSQVHQSFFAPDDVEEVMEQEGNGNADASTPDYPSLPKSILRIPHNDLSVGRLLGQGSFGSVYEVTSLGKSRKFKWARKLLPLPGSASGKDKVRSKSNCRHTHKLGKQLHNDDRKQSDIVVKVLKHTMVQKPSLLAACAADMAKEAMILHYLREQVRQQPSDEELQRNDRYNRSSSYVSRDNNAHIVQLYAWSQCGLDGYITGRHDAFFVVLERLEETLSKRVQDWKVQTNGQRSLISTINEPFWRERILAIEQIGQAIQHFHKHRIIHRDIKPDNIGFDKQNRIKVFDLDVCRIMPAMQNEEDDPRSQLFKFTKKVGSPRYMSPECARGDKYNQQTDIYSLALVMHEVMTLQKPFEHVSAEDHSKLVVNGGVRPHLSSMWPREMSGLVQDMWQEDSTQRPHIDDILHKLRVEYESY